MLLVQLRMQELHMSGAFLYSQCFIVLDMNAQSICHLSKFFLQIGVLSWRTHEDPSMENPVGALKAAAVLLLPADKKMGLDSQK